jgi:large subunit ribosomal protein L35
VTSQSATVGHVRTKLLKVATGCEDGGIANMPKRKTHKATAKRFKITGSGKLRRRKQGGSHLRRRKSKRVRRSFDKNEAVAPVDVKRVRRILGLRKRRKR